MKKVAFLAAILIGGISAIAQNSKSGEANKSACNAANCPGSGAECCKDLDNNTVFYKKALVIDPGT